MLFRLPLALPLLLLAASGCDDGLARPSTSSVSSRVEAATARLEGSEAGLRVLDAIEAHGGLATWYANGPIHFRYAYTRLDSLGEPTGEPLDTRQIVDTWASRAVHTLASDSTVQFGWTGTEAWAMPNAEAVPTDPRFWSLTPYYFVSVPFVFADEGVNLEMADTLTVEGTTYEQVRVTFDAGTGDAPDDYYYLLVDPASNRVGGVRYVVSYGPFNPDGGHTPETIMLYDGAQTVSGITMQEGFRSFAWQDSTRGPGAAKATGRLTEVRFEGDRTDADFGMPASGEVQAEV